MMLLSRLLIRALLLAGLLYGLHVGYGRLSDDAGVWHDRVVYHVGVTQ